MKKTIAVIFGGRSPEHDVSIITAHIPIIQALKAAQSYDVWPVYIAKDGAWYSEKAMNDLSYFQIGLQEKLRKLKPLQISFGDGLSLTWPGIRSKTLKIDLAFPAMHGTYGEDGSLMGLLRLANVPFVGCDMDASVIAMDKVLAKQVTGAAGIPSVPYAWFSDTEYSHNKAGVLKQVEQSLTYPVFVKPVHLGSSIAITKVNSKDKLEDAIEVALHYDNKVIIENGVTNLTEVTLPIMGNDDLTFGLIEKSLVSFFDFSEKYLKGGKKGGGANSQYSELPAKISDELANRVRELGKMTYRAIGATGIARVDFLIDNGLGKVYMNEINTLPGSLYHHNWRKAGVSSVDLVERLIQLAEEAYARKNRVTSTFSSEVLEVVSGPKVNPD